MKHVWQAHPHDGIVAVTTFVKLTARARPTPRQGILAGAALALDLYLYRTMKPRVGYTPTSFRRNAARRGEISDLDACKEISMIRFDGQLYFANTSYFEDKILGRVAAQGELIRHRGR